MSEEVRSQPASEMAMPTTEVSEPVVPHCTKKTLPLNSGRLTAGVMGMLAKELGLSVLATLENMRQIVSGKIEAAGREPRNVRVELTDSERGVIISLRDDEGAFLVCQPEETEGRGAGHEGGSSGELGGGVSDGGRTRSARPVDGDDHDDVVDHAELEAELDRLTEEDENTALFGENTILRKEVSE